MNQFVITALMLLLAAGSAEAGESEVFRALSKVQGATILTNQELSDVEGSTLFYGTVQMPVYFESISAFMTEVLFTLLHVDGRTPIVSYTTAHPVVTPLPNGGITVGVESHTVILVKTLVCMVCTKF
jgi:hypothetical protein